MERRRRQKFSPAALKTTKNLLKSIIFGQNLEVKILYKKAPPPLSGVGWSKGGAFLTGIPLMFECNSMPQNWKIGSSDGTVGVQKRGQRYPLDIKTSEMDELDLVLSNACLEKIF